MIHKVAAAQLSSVFLDNKKSVAKACKAIKEASANGAQLIVFPEAFIAGYPDWVWLLPPHKNNELNALYVELVNNAVSIPDDATRQLCSAAKEAQINVVVGVNELNAEASGSTIYNSILYISEAGDIVDKHRKLILREVNLRSGRKEMALA